MGQITINTKGFEDHYDETHQSKEKKANGNGNQFNSNYEELKKHYFNAYLSKDEKEKKMVIRILPWSAEDNNVYKSVKAHCVKVRNANGDKVWQTFMCPKNEDPNANCPFCELASRAKKAMFESQDVAQREKYKQILKMNEAKPHILMRVVDRGDEASGVKFWISKDGYKSPYEQIYNLRQGKMDDNVDILDPYTGKDLRLILSRDDNNKRVLTVTDVDGRSPIFPTEEEMHKWVNDTTDYKQLFPIKSFDVLKIYAEGGYPIYSKELGKYADKFKLEEMLKEQKEQDIQSALTQSPKDFSTFVEPQGNSNTNTTQSNSVPFSSVQPNFTDEEGIPF
jgi:hypothetical protein